MTTILVDTKKGRVYADSQLSCTSYRTMTLMDMEKDVNPYYESSNVKIYFNDDTVVGAAGDWGLCSELKQSILDKQPLPAIPEGKDAQAIAIHRVGSTIRCVRYSIRTKKKLFGLIKTREFVTKEIDPQIRFLAIGSGSQFVLGAILSGASVRDAFKSVYKNDTGSGGKIVCRGFDLFHEEESV